MNTGMEICVPTENRLQSEQKRERRGEMHLCHLSSINHSIEKICGY